jgi:hypothetical protein
MASLLPVRPYDARGPSGLRFPEALENAYILEFILSCIWTPPWRLRPKLAVSRSRFPAIKLRIDSRNSLPELLTLQHIRTLTAHFFASHKASEKVCLPSQMSHPQGLATLSMVSALKSPRKPISAPNTPGLLSPELSSNSAASKRFPFSISSRRLDRKPFQAFHLRSDDLIHGTSRIPHCPQMFSPGRDPCSPELSASRALPPH